MAENKKPAPAGMARFNLTLPEKTLEWFRQQSEEEGVPIQSLMAPVLNAVAKGTIKGGYSIVADAHGNAKAGRERRDHRQAA